jgi:hypothetical protein
MNENQPHGIGCNRSVCSVVEHPYFTTRGVATVPAIMRAAAFVLFVAQLYAALILGSGGCSDPCADMNCNAGSSCDYDSIVHASTPVGYWPLTGSNNNGHITLDTADKINQSGDHRLDGSFKGPAISMLVDMPDGSHVPLFNFPSTAHCMRNRNGTDTAECQYVEIKDEDPTDGQDDLLEITTKGVLTFEAWVKRYKPNFDAVENPNSTDSQGHYIHWMGKGETGNQSWASRMYNEDSQDRSHRISGYAFNLNDPPPDYGLGSFFEDSVDDWVHYAFTIDTTKTSVKKCDGTTISTPRGYTRIFRNGKCRDVDSLKGTVNDTPVEIVPMNANAPTRIGTQSRESFFQGAIGKVAIYNRALEEPELKNHYDHMCR